VLWSVKCLVACCGLDMRWRCMKLYSVALGKGKVEPIFWLLC